MAIQTLVVSLCLLFTILETCTGQTDGPVVNTNNGPIRGFLGNDYLGRPYDGFLGIPFAKPPVDNLRWKKPERPEPWLDTLNTTEYSLHCIQPISFIYPLAGFGGNDSEDCLYLNVFVPVGVEDALVNLLPVMVFIYGGGFSVGTTEMYTCEELATTGHVITVSINYRISIMGFLSTGDEAAPGNYGLWDLKAGLEWVNENIPNFGGDTSRITIFGHSAGASAVSLHVLSPQTNTLFQRAISLSGDAYSIEGSQAKATAQTIADLFWCNTTDSEEIVDCLREIDAKELDESMFLGAIINWNNVIRQPVTDGDFITKDPRESWLEGVGSHIDFMTGYTYHDSYAFFMGNLLGLPLNRTNDGNMEREEIFEIFVNRYSDEDNGEEIIQQLYDRFPLMNDSDAATASEAATRMETLRAVASGSFFEVEKHSESSGTGSAYHYEFGYKMSFLHQAAWVNGSHLDDIYGVLGDSFMKIYRNDILEADFNEDDRSMSRCLMSYYANFAYSGNPNDGPHTVDTFWPEYNTVTRQYLLETPTPIVIAHDQKMLDDYDFFLYDQPNMREHHWSTFYDDISEDMIGMLFGLN